MQVQQRQHLRHPRTLTRPRRQDRRGEPAPLTRRLVDALVVDPWLTHRHRTRRRGHLPGRMKAVADHQPSAVGVNLATMRLDVTGNLGQQRRGQHLPGTVADNLIEQRRADRVGLGGDFNYFEHEGVPSRTSASTPVLIRATGLQIILEKVRPFTSPGRGPSTGSDHCSREGGQTATPLWLAPIDLPLVYESDARLEFDRFEPKVKGTLIVCLCEPAGRC